MQSVMDLVVSLQHENTNITPRTDGMDSTLCKSNRNGFLKGPIPLDWLRTASELSANALRVALALWFKAGMEGNENIAMTPQLAAKFCCRNRHSLYRALADLEAQRLIKVERKRGRAARVSIVLLGATK